MSSAGIVEAPQPPQPSASSKKGTRKRMKDRSPIWEHFEKQESDEGIRAQCKYCALRYNCDPKKNGTSTLWAHLNKCRKYPYNTPRDSKQSLLSFQCVNKKTGVTSSGLSYQKFDAQSCRKALALMIIIDELPFKFVEAQGFRNFCGVLEPRFHVPSRVTIAKDCYEIFLDLSKIVLEDVDEDDGLIPETVDIEDD